MAMQVPIHAAKTNLSKLVEAALAGEEVVILRGSKPVVRLTPIRDATFALGLLAGKLGDGPDFLAPMDPEEIADWERD